MSRTQHVCRRRRKALGGGGPCTLLLLYCWGGTRQLTSQVNQEPRAPKRLHREPPEGNLHALLRLLPRCLPELSINS